MKTNIYHCDRCSQEMPADEGLTLVFCNHPGESGRIKKSDIIKQIDFCEDCLRDLRELLDLDSNYFDKRIIAEYMDGVC